jgi:hypothetical protein
VATQSVPGVSAVVPPLEPSLYFVDPDGEQCRPDRSAGGQ